MSADNVVRVRPTIVTAARRSTTTHSFDSVSLLLKNLLGVLLGFFGGVCKTVSECI